MDLELVTQPARISTFSLVAVVLTMLAWQCEVAELILFLFGKAKLDWLSLTVILTLTTVLTIFAWFWGKKELVRVSYQLRTAALTTTQAWLVFGLVVGFCAIWAIVIVRMARN